MKILHLDTGSGWRGGQQQVLWLMEGLRQRGHQQLLAAPARSPLAETMKQRGFPVSPLASGGRSFANLKTVRQVAGDFDILHAHDAHAHSLAWLGGAPRRTGAGPCLIVSRRVAFPIGRFGRRKYAAGDAYIAVSQYGREQLLHTGVPPAKIFVIYDGVSVPSLSAPGARGEFRQRWGAAGNTHVIGTFTSLAPEKRLQEQLDLLAELPASVHLWIGRPAAEPGSHGDRFSRCGVVAEKSETSLLEDAKQRGLQNRFRILPLAEELGAFLNSLDVFLYLSRSEGLGSAILLAMAHGLPVVASRVGGIPEIVHQGETGLLVADHAPGDQFTKELSAAVSLLLDDQTLRSQLGSAAREFVLANATSEVMVEKTEAVYEQVLQASETADGSRRGAKGATP